MNEKIKCPVPINGVECGQEEILEKKKYVKKSPDGKIIVHHECGLHNFHIELPGGQWMLCDCPE